MCTWSVYWPIHATRRCQICTRHQMELTFKRPTDGTLKQEDPTSSCFWKPRFDPASIDQVIWDTPSFIIKVGQYCDYLIKTTAGCKFFYETRIFCSRILFYSQFSPIIFVFFCKPKFFGGNPNKFYLCRWGYFFSLTRGKVIAKRKF